MISRSFYHYNLVNNWVNVKKGIRQNSNIHYLFTISQDLLLTYLDVCEAIEMLYDPNNQTS